MARKDKRKGKGISESQDSHLQETQSIRSSFDHNEVSKQEIVPLNHGSPSQILRPSSELQTDEGAHHASNSIIICSIYIKFIYPFFFAFTYIHSLCCDLVVPSLLHSHQGSASCIKLPNPSYYYSIIASGWLRIFSRTRSCALKWEIVTILQVQLGIGVRIQL